MTPSIDPDAASRLHVAAVVGNAALACELEDLGISSPEESLRDARFLRPRILTNVDRRRSGGESEEESGPVRRLAPDDAHVLYAAAVVGPEELAAQLARLGVSAPGDAHEDARLLRRDLLDAVERIRRNSSGQ